ncbi:MAG: recombinase family protein [Acidobacteriaceae bacterium]
MTARKRAAIYSRVSTSGQTTENQSHELKRVAQQRDWEIVEFYEDAGISGAKGRDQRPALDRLHKDATRGRFDVVMAWSVDRLGRSLHQLVSFMAEMGQLGIGIYLHQQALDSSTPAGKAMLNMCGVFAEFEREMIVERVNSGLRRARAQGKRLGRPTVGHHVEAAVRQLRRRGSGIRAIARELNIGVSVVQRVVHAEQLLASSVARRRPAM